MITLYSRPEKFGLTVVGEIDYADIYAFDIVAVYRDAEGALVYAEDSGCSCPSPFEDHGLDDLVPCTPAELQARLVEKAKDRDPAFYWDADQQGTRFDVEILELMKRVVA